MTTTQQATERRTATSTTGERRLDTLYRSPGFHWVGDGFRVAGYFSAIPDAVRKLSPFLLLDYGPEQHFPPSDKPRGVGVHPHRGFETVTVAFQGSVAHHDSAGGGGVIGPGDVQWMTAGSGILHKEYHEAEFAKRGGAFQMAQLWVNLPRAHKMSAPRYQPLTAGEIPVVTLPDEAGSVRVIAGEFRGQQGAAKTFSPVHLFDVKLAAGKSLELSIPAHHNLAALIMEGDLEIGGQAATKHDFALFDHGGETVRITAKKDAQLLVLGGEPIDEPVVQYGPFVMNTEREIVEAFDDFRSGKFGHLDD